ncbi:hypothetical protein GYA37_03700 [candidate division WWE3 bacterium]|uniref:50S ribosomal protein L28 n=1 Tax=candidate division WWE3 bacterium TaxID=2053526 RepID=A0A7X9E7H6_UNCKA|nr:hypothetical protein [candidate division WWE3 bacterium]
MSRVCDICGKTYQKSNLVPRGIGNRVTRRTKSHNKANLRVKRFLINGVRVKFKLCASCLKRIKKEDKDMQREMEAKAQLVEFK